MQRKGESDMVWLAFVALLGVVTSLAIIIGFKAGIAS